MMLMKLRRVAASLVTDSSSNISQARLMVAIGVLISWVMLLMKSVFISSSFRWEEIVRNENEKRREMRNIMQMLMTV